MKGLNLKITRIFLGGVLFLGANSGEALVSPEHYEKLKNKNEQKTRESEKVQAQRPVKTQGHRSGEGQSPAGKADRR